MLPILHSFVNILESLIELNYCVFPYTYSVRIMNLFGFLNFAHNPCLTKIGYFCYIRTLKLIARIRMLTVNEFLQ